MANTTRSVNIVRDGYHGLRCCSGHIDARHAAFWLVLFESLLIIDMASLYIAGGGAAHGITISSAHVTHATRRAALRATPGHITIIVIIH